MSRQVLFGNIYPVRTLIIWDRVDILRKYLRASVDIFLRNWQLNYL